MSHHGIAGNGFGNGDTLQRFFPAHEQRLDAPVLIAQLDIQVKDLLAIADKPEMPRLDDARMDRPDAHLMQLFTVDTVEWMVGYRLASVRSVECIPQWLQPGVVGIGQTKIFSQLAFETLECQVPCSERRQCPSMRTDLGR